MKGEYDLVYATSPPLFVGAAGLAARHRRRIPFVFEVRDLWPESAVALGELSSNRAPSPLAEKLEWLLYKRANRVVAVTRRDIQSRLKSAAYRPQTRPHPQRCEHRPLPLRRIRRAAKCAPS